MVNETPSEATKIYGGKVLKQVKEKLQSFKEQLEEKNSKVAIIQFSPPEGLSDTSSQQTTSSKLTLSRYKAADASSRAKRKTFNSLGISTSYDLLPWENSEDDFIELLTDLGEAKEVAGIIVQYPMPRYCKDNLWRIPPDKDVDSLTENSEYPSLPATSEAITRVVEAFAEDDSLVAVVGARGFVGRGVVGTLEEKGIRVMGLDAQDLGFTEEDLLQVQDADIVVSATGQPETLDERHLLPSHRLVVDCGFSPIEDEIYGDVKKSAYSIPQCITPVPGGTGPMEMAILAERIVERELDIELEPWKLEKEQYQKESNSVVDQQSLVERTAPVVSSLLNTIGQNQFEGNRHSASWNPQTNRLTLVDREKDSTIMEAEWDEENNLWVDRGSSLTEEKAQYFEKKVTPKISAYIQEQEDDSRDRNSGLEL